MQSTRAAAILSVSALLCQSASAWWSTGHMLSARIAYDKLMKETPEVVERAEGALSHLAEFTTMEKDYPFVECATFADNIKSKGWYDTSTWHYVDTPFFDGYEAEDYYPDDQNATYIMGELISALKNANSPNLESGYVDWALGDSFNMRMFIHIVSDIHQPLHATTRYSPEHKQGDRGGNSFGIKGEQGIDELHALWDAVLYEYSNDLSQPLSNSDWEYLGQESAKLTSLYPESSFSELSAKYTEWDDESFVISSTFVYEIEEDSVPEDEYIKEGAIIAEKQLVKAGYRIAMTLQDIWGYRLAEPKQEKFLA